MILSTFVIAFIYQALKRRDPNYLTDKGLPKGSMGYPIIGNALEFTNPNWFLFDKIKNYGETFKFSLLGRDICMFPFMI